MVIVVLSQQVFVMATYSQKYLSFLLGIAFHAFALLQQPVQLAVYGIHTRLNLLLPFNIFMTLEPLLPQPQKRSLDYLNGLVHRRINLLPLFLKTQILLPLKIPLDLFAFQVQFKNHFR